MIAVMQHRWHSVWYLDIKLERAPHTNHLQMLKQWSSRMSISAIRLVTVTTARPRWSHDGEILIDSLQYRDGTIRPRHRLNPKESKWLNVTTRGLSQAVSVRALHVTWSRSWGDYAACWHPHRIIMGSSMVQIMAHIWTPITWPRI